MTVLVWVPEKHTLDMLPFIFRKLREGETKGPPMKVPHRKKRGNYKILTSCLPYIPSLINRAICVAINYPRSFRSLKVVKPIK